jgi:RND family efflux transporter MFP subunit
VQSRHVGLLVFLISLIGCNANAPVKPMIKPPEVLITQAITEQIVDFEDFTGHTESRNMVEVKARVTGYLEKVHFKDGDTVKEGDLLFEIDPRPYQVEVQRAEAALTQSEVRFKRLDVDLVRASNLRQTKAISPEDFEKIKADRNDAEAAIGVARADLAKSKLNLEYTKITVPTLDNGGKFTPSQPRTGRVGRRQKDPGNLIKADDTMLTTIVTLNPMYIYFDVDERTVLNMRSLIQDKKINSIKEMTFRFGLASDENKLPYSGRIEFEDNKLDSGTGTLTLRGIYENTNRLSPGLFVRLRLFVGSPRKAVMVPERALGTDQGQRFLYVVKNETDKEGKMTHKAEYRGGTDIEVGALYDGWRVIEKGIAADDLIIWSGLQRVRKDVNINVKQQEPPRPKLN